MEIWQLAGTSLSLFQDLISMLWDHVAEQQKQTAILEHIACVQELDQEGWVHIGSDDLETGSEENEEDGMEESEVQGGKELVNKVDKGKGKERAEDGNADIKNDRNEGRDRNGRVDGETLQ